MRVHAVPATIAVAPDAQLADVVLAERALVPKDFAAEIEELYR
jgi:hypothetical protein